MTTPHLLLGYSIATEYLHPLSISPPPPLPVRLLVRVRVALALALALTMPLGRVQRGWQRSLRLRLLWQSSSSG
jgi:hypothetical protein